MRAEYVDHMGDDLRVVNSARVSFDKESEWEEHVDPIGCGLERRWKNLTEKDEKLIHYLAKHSHFTPFTHATITLRETVPIFVARQRFKHVVGFTYNEVSRRYVDGFPEIYFPQELRSRPDGSVKQGSGGKHPYSETYIQYMKEDAKRALNLYGVLIEDGVAPEQARMVLPQSMYTSYYVTGSLAAFARAYKQRIDSHAQQEIRELAQQWDTTIRPLFPVSWSALTE